MAITRYSRSGVRFVYPDRGKTLIMRRWRGGRYAGWSKPYGAKVQKSKKNAATWPSKRSNAMYQLTKLPVFGKASQKIKHMLYYETVRSLSPVIGGTTTEFYWANGLFDPNAQVGGHQPIGFDQIMALYEHYAVIRSRITVTFKVNLTAGLAGRVGIYLSPDAIGLTNIGQIMENGLVKSKLIDVAGSTQDKVVMSLDCDVKNYFGKTKYHDIMDDEKLTGDVSNNPTEGVYYGVFASDIYGNNAVQVEYEAVISYDAIFFEPRKLGQS